MNKEELKIEKERTLKQNDCMWQYFADVSRECNNAGKTIPIVVKAFEEHGLDATPKFIEILWRTIIFEKYGYKSTTQMSTIEATETYEEMNRGLASMGLHVEWPSWDSVINRDN